MENFNKNKDDLKFNRKEVRNGIFFDFDEKTFTDKNGDKIPLHKLVENGLLDKVAYKLETNINEGENKFKKENLDEFSILIIDLNNLLIQLETKKIERNEARDLLNDLKDLILKYKKEKELIEIISKITNFLKNEK